MISNSNLKISQEKQKKDNEKLIQIFNCIDNHNSWCLKAGAGSGKTYSLVETIKYIISKKGKSIIENNQKIVCITYTNVAANELKNRVGLNDFIIISTIHDFVWNIIKNYQSQLKKYVIADIETETENLKEEISKINLECDKSSEDLKRIILPQKEEFWKHANEKAGPFKKYLKSINIEGVSNASKAQSLFKSIIKLDNLSSLKEIDYPEKVKYNPRLNTRNLTTFRISHDDVLEYFKRLINDYDTLKKIMCDAYPYILIDEYQDTNPVVIEALEKLIDYSKEKELKFSVGCYGDEKQAIYNDKENDIIHLKKEHFKFITSEFNWRSTQKIIDFANKIRDDEVKQQTIYLDNTGDNVKFYEQSFKADTDIELIRKEWNIDIDNKLHVFVLKNELVAEYNGFSRFYEYFEAMVGYLQLRNYILSNDKTRLGEVCITIYNLIDFIKKITEEGGKTSLKEIIPKDIIANLNYKQLQYIGTKIKCVRDKIKNKKNMKLEDLLEIVFDYTGDEEFMWKSIISNITNISIEDFKTFHITSIIEFEDYLNSQFVDNKDIKTTDILEIDINEFYNWYNYIDGNYTNKATIYHTFHSTKGLEFDNVVIIIDAGFNYQNFFKGMYNSGNIKSYFFRNLFYVAVTRAKKNLIIISDQLEEHKENFKEEFDGLIEWQ